MGGAPLERAARAGLEVGAGADALGVQAILFYLFYNGKDMDGHSSSGLREQLLLVK
jgi:hypothetical protein